MMILDQETIEILSQGRTDENLFFLPDKILSRKTYEKVNKALVAMGGKWKGGKTKAHVFDESVDDKIDNAILTGRVTSEKQELNFFPTPDNVADQMVTLLMPTFQDRILEPSAGRGALMSAIERVVHDPNLTWVEMSQSNATFIEKNFPRAKFWGHDFLQVHPKSLFDKIIMNPPFSMNGTGRQTDMDHVAHALKFLADGGRIVSVMSPSLKFRTNKKTNAFRDFLEDFCDWEIVDLPDGSFKESGTMISAVLFVAER